MHSGLKKKLEFWFNDFYDCFLIDILQNCVFVNSSNMAFLDTSSVGGKPPFYLIKPFCWLAIKWNRGR